MQATRSAEMIGKRRMQNNIANMLEAEHTTGSLRAARTGVSRANVVRKARRAGGREEPKRWHRPAGFQAD
eukprot:5838473-Alexandrium_andersonii.AAC.1